MVYKSILALLIILTISYLFYSQLPSFANLIKPQEVVQKIEEVKLPVNLTISESNPRWNHFPLKVFIDASYQNLRSSYPNDVKVALSEWTKAASFVTFTEVTNAENADIVVKWVDRLKEGSKDTIGNTDLKFLDTERFKVIQSAEIQLLTKEDGKVFTDLDMVNLAMHEIGHAIGLDHVDSKDSIMYPKLNLPSVEVKQISILDLDALKQIYKLPAKPDMILIEANATKSTISSLIRTRYFVNISVTVQNEGLSDAQESILKILTDGETAKTSVVPKLEVGNKYLLFFGNLEVSSDFSSVELITDPENSIDELDEGNNKIILKIS